MYKFISDKYKSTRGGHSRLLDISCESCGFHICYYQKDGPGILKRMYKDRIINGSAEFKDLSCSKCKRLLGVGMVYEKENRSAYRLFVGTIKKKIVSKNQVE